MFYIGKKPKQRTKYHKVEIARVMVEKGRPICNLTRELGTTQKNFQ
jgi:hypothetical protein